MQPAALISRTETLLRDMEATTGPALPAKALFALIWQVDAFGRLLSGYTLGVSLGRSALDDTPQVPGMSSYYAATNDAVLSAPGAGHTQPAVLVPDGYAPAAHPVLPGHGIVPNAGVSIEPAPIIGSVSTAGELPAVPDSWHPVRTGVARRAARPATQGLTFVAQTQESVRRTYLPVRLLLPAPTADGQSGIQVTAQEKTLTEQLTDELATLAPAAKPLPPRPTAPLGERVGPPESVHTFEGESLHSLPATPPQSQSSAQPTGKVRRRRNETRTARRPFVEPAAGLEAVGKAEKSIVSDMLTHEPTNSPAGVTGVHSPQQTPDAHLPIKTADDREIGPPAGAELIIGGLTMKPARVLSIRNAEAQQTTTTTGRALLARLGEEHEEMARPAQRAAGHAATASFDGATRHQPGVPNWEFTGGSDNQVPSNSTEPTWYATADTASRQQRITIRESIASQRPETAPQTTVSDDLQRWTNAEANEIALVPLLELPITPRAAHRAGERLLEGGPPQPAPALSPTFLSAALAPPGLSEPHEPAAGSSGVPHRVDNRQVDVAESAMQDEARVSWLAEQIERLLREEARRHGISL